MSTIQSDMLELKSINTEIRRIDGNKKELKIKAAAVEKRIIDYLKEKDGVKGVKTKDASGADTGFLLQTAQKTLTKSEVEKKKSAIEILKANGVTNPEKILKELDDGRRGNKIPIHKLKIIQNK
jgi:phosphomevalonate kinase